MTVKERHPDLETLIQIQDLDLKSMHLQERVEAIPGELESLDAELEAARRNLTKVQENVESHGRDRRQLEGEVEALREKRTKYKSQLMEVKTNEAYQAMLHEIEFTEKKIEKKEDKILEHMLEADEHNRELEKTRKEFEAAEAKISKEKKDLEKFASQSSDELARIKEERERVMVLLPSEIVTQYQRIASARNGVALAPVQDSCCGLCHVRLRPQLLADVRSNQQIIACESCSRILYLPVSQE